MKIGIKLIACLTALICLLSCVSVFPVLAEGSGNAGISTAAQNIGIAKKKIVSVMYDNSGSMSNTDNRSGYARYALRMLMALLGENDEMVIVPMNRFVPGSNNSIRNDGGQYPVEKEVVDLANPNREAVVEAVLDEPLLEPVIGAGTPHTPIGASIKWLVDGGSGSETNEGLKDGLHLNESNENVEHWLIIITDGMFVDCVDAYDTAHTAIEPYIADYPSLNTIYFGMGQASMDLSGQDINTKYKFNSFRAGNASAIISEMQKITNLLTGRYTLDPNCYSWENNQSSGTTLTIRLNDVGFSLKNISVIAQNCGAKLTGSTHNGTKMNITNSCVITSELPSIQNGYSAVLDVSPNFLNGTVKLTFDKAVKKSDLSILAEPAFRLETYFEYLNGSNWQSITMEEINATLLEGNKIRVGYRVFDQTSGAEVDLNNSTLFGSCEGIVTYAGNSFVARYAYGNSVTTQGAEIALKEGNNDLGIAVSIMGGSYIMQQSAPLSISGVVVTGECFDFGYNRSKPDEAKAVFSAKDTNGRAININNSGYSWSVKATGPNGQEIGNVSSSANSGGDTITVTITADASEFGNYTVAFKVKSSTSGTERNVTQVMKYDYVAPPDLTIRKATAPNSFDSGGSAAFEYNVIADGIAVTNYTDYKLTAKVTAPDGTAVEVTPRTDSNGNITVNVEALVGMFGRYRVELKAMYKEGTPQEASVSVADEIDYSFNTSDPHAPKITIQKVGFSETCGSGGQVTWKYKVLVDGKQVTKAELDSNFSRSLVASDPKGAFANVTSSIAGDGTITVTFTATDGVYGEYNVMFEVKSKYDVDFRYIDESVVKNLPGEGGSGSGPVLTIDKDDFTGSCGSDKKAEWKYKLWLDGKQLTKADLNDYTWSVSATAPDGSAVNVTSSVSNDGAVVVTLTAIDSMAGEYVVVFDIKYNYAPDDIYGQDTAKVEYKFSLEIKENHSDRITTDSLNGKLEYRIYAGGSQLTGAELDRFELSLKITTPDGNELAVIPQIGDSGIISATVPVTARAFGHYNAEFTIVSKTDANMTASVSYALVYHPSVVEIQSTRIGELKNGVSSVNMEHTVIVEGVQMTVSELNRFSWKLEALDPGENKADTQISIEEDGRIISSIDVSSSGFGLYQAMLSINFCGDVEEGATTANAGCYYERNDELKFYPVSLELMVTAGNLSFNEYDFTQNENTAFEFELYADGSPFSFHNGLTDMRLIIAGMDMTEFAVSEGNVLTYIPQDDQLGNLSVGEHDVSLTVDCKDIPALKASVTTKLSVIKTVYEIVTIDLGGKSVDRFDLDNLDAALYFQVLRDGNPLNLEELKTAWENGEIERKDEKGVFGWQFWLPCGSETTIEEIDGNPVIIFKVTKDWIKPFDTFAAMLILNGDKPITVTYKDAVGTDAIRFTPSGVWSYVWRILVILFTIHTILYIIGFFNGKCKNIPSGMVVSASVGKGPKDPVTFRVTTEINIKKKDLIAWHALRFIPNKHGYLWYNQPSKTGPARSQFGFDRKGNFGIFFENPSIYRINVLVPNPLIAKLGAMKTKLKKHPGKGKYPTVTAFAFEVKGSLGKDATAAPVKSNSRVDSGCYYGKYDSAGNLMTVMFFVKKE